MPSLGVRSPWDHTSGVSPDERRTSFEFKRTHTQKTLEITGRALQRIIKVIV